MRENLKRVGTWEVEVIRLPTGRWVELAHWTPRKPWTTIDLVLGAVLAALAVGSWIWEVIRALP